jgi:muramidase (phage lysozyme)
MKSNFYLLITALFLVSCDQQEVATQQVQPSTESVVATTTIAAQQVEPDNYDDCITQFMQAISWSRPKGEKVYTAMVSKWLDSQPDSI